MAYHVSEVNHSKILLHCPSMTTPWPCSQVCHLINYYRLKKWTMHNCFCYKNLCIHINFTFMCHALNYSALPTPL